MNRLSLERVELRLGQPAARWSGRCYEIAQAIVQAGLVPARARAVYGHYLGRVDCRSPFFQVSAAGFVQHGWVNLGPELILDPTRWVFEAVAPYLHYGPPGGEYDEGGNRWRTAMRPPAPAFDAAERNYEVPHKLLQGAAWAHVRKLLELGPDQPKGRLGLGQLVWLANVSPDEMGRHVAAIYATLEALELQAFIPIDSRRMVEALKQSRRVV